MLGKLYNKLKCLKAIDVFVSIFRRKLIMNLLPPTGIIWTAFPISQPQTISLYIITTFDTEWFWQPPWSVYAKTYNLMAKQK